MDAMTSSRLRSMICTRLAGKGSTASILGALCALLTVALGIAVLSAGVSAFSATPTAGTPQVVFTLAEASGQTVTGAAGETAKTALNQAQQVASKAANDLSGLVRSDPWRWWHIIGAGVAVMILLFSDILRPGSLERSGKRDVQPFGAHVWFLCALLVLGMQMVAGGFATLLPEKWMGAPDSVQHKAVLSSVVYGVSILSAILLAKLIGASSKNAGLVFSARSIAWGLMAFVLAWPIVQSSSFLWLELNQRFSGPEPTTSLAHSTLQLLVDNRENPWAWTLAGLAIIAAPVVEEMVYRGFLQSAILRLTEKPWTSIIVSAALFAGVHMVGKEPPPWYAAATVGVLGVCMGIAYERTKEIGVPITMHVLFNLSNVLLALYTTK
jgi:membrane protease YdiL (CAAX protease family)